MRHTCHILQIPTLSWHQLLISYIDIRAKYTRLDKFIEERWRHDGPILFECWRLGLSHEKFLRIHICLKDQSEQQLEEIYSSSVYEVVRGWDKINSHAPVFVFFFVIALNKLDTLSVVTTRVNNIYFSNCKNHENNLPEFERLLRVEVEQLTTHIFRGWNMADSIGASKRVVEYRRGVNVSEAKSHMIKFQSFDVVRRYREFLDQLLAHRHRETQRS